MILRYWTAMAGGCLIAAIKALLPRKAGLPRPLDFPSGISVVIPSRNGQDLLERLLPRLVAELDGIPSEVIVVDNGSDDETATWLSSAYLGIQVLVSLEPLSFAAAVNRGIASAHFSHVCLLNNDMVIGAGFFHALRAAFEKVPDLFSATAQIFFPEGVRREETGKAVMPPLRPASEFPLRCDEPVPGEDLSYVLYASGGCSLYDMAKLRQLGCFGEMYRPAYVEDLDAGYRAWLRGWPTVFVAGATVVHHHRATTSRYYSDEELRLVTEVNYLRFLARAVVSPRLFLKLWTEAVRRLRTDPVIAAAALGFATRAFRWVERPPVCVLPEHYVLALGSGNIAVFPGRKPSNKPVVITTEPNVRTNDACVLVCLVDELRPEPEWLQSHVEVVLVRRTHTAFDSTMLAAALSESRKKWNPVVPAP
ncbi:MAG: glycosyltransferase family 2 protein [Bryobacteraceae bacterium]|nr:glycosyltransferase family 2 protein [Bryobacteraceae bacterium]